MRRQSQDEVIAAASRRLELLRRELEQAGLTRLAEEPDAPDPRPSPGLAPPAPDPGLSLGLAPPARIEAAGRHLRPGRSGRGWAWLAERLPETLRGRVDLARGPVLLVVGLVMLAIVSSAFAVLRSSGHGDVVPAASRPASSPLVETSPGAAAGSGASGSTAPSGASPGASAGASPGAAAGSGASGSVTVDVAGKVRRPGVAVLPTGSRVVDAVKRAGGARRGVDLSTINLARVLVDGEQILVGGPASAGGAAAGAAAAASPAAGALVNLNTATEEQLDTLPGVGPVTAKKILQWRGDHGAFSAVDELLEVDGIGEKTLAEIAPLVTL